MAVPAYPFKRYKKLADGSTLELTLTGDENIHYYQSDNGQAFRLDKGSLLPISAEQLATMRQTADQQTNQQNVRRVNRMKKRVGTFSGITGTKKGLVILVNFLDNEFTVPDPQKYFWRYFNEQGFSEYGMQGSVNDYFRAQSYGQFGIDFDVVGPYQLAQVMSAYGAPSDYGHDTDARQMALDACRKANSDVNYADYDWDGDGEVDQVFIIYAGYGEAQGADENTIWPHEAQITPTKMDGVYIRTYACSCELQGDSGTIPDGIGTACHEFSHCLGYPDLYNTDSGGYSSLTYYDLLCAGSYNGSFYNGTYLSSTCPAAYTAYERWMAGWLTPTELKGGERIRGLKPLTSAPDAYILYNDANHDEYYMIENRQLEGFDSALYGHGMLIMHIDYENYAWTSNSVNADSKHERLGLVCADGRAGYSSAEGLAGDPFPGIKEVTSFTDVTTPAATLFNANADGSYQLHKFIENIKETNGQIDFDVVYCPLLGIPAPAVAKADRESFLAEWPAVEGAEQYELSLTELPSKSTPEEALVLKEDFKGCYKSTASLTDISKSINNYLSATGYSGSYLYQTPNYLRFGTSSANGSLRTPVQNAMNTGQMTVVMKLAPFKAGTPVTGTVNVLFETKTKEEFSLDFDQEITLVIHPKTVINERNQLLIQPVGRCYISYLAIYDGNFSAQELGLDNSAVEKAPALRVKTTNFTTKSTHYNFANLNQTSIYLLRVRSMSSRRNSDWSEEITVMLPDIFDPDGITDTPAHQQRGSWYNMQGQQVFSPSHGIYIHDGKKVLR